MEGSTSDLTVVIGRAEPEALCCQHPSVAAGERWGGGHVSLPGHQPSYSQLHRRSPCAFLGCPEQEGNVPGLPNPHLDVPGRPNKRAWVSSLSRAGAGVAMGRVRRHGCSGLLRAISG